jgi:hypothetical protein
LFVSESDYFQKLLLELLVINPLNEEGELSLLAAQLQLQRAQFLIMRQFKDEMQRLEIFA